MLTAKHRVLVLAAFALAIISVNSCIKVNQTLGSVYVPTDRDLKVKTVSFDVPLGMKMADSLQTSTSYMPSGIIIVFNKQEISIFQGGGLLHSF